MSGDADDDDDNVENVHPHRRRFSSSLSSSSHFLFLTRYITIINFSPRTNYFRVEKLKRECSDENAEVQRNVC